MFIDTVRGAPNAANRKDIWKSERTIGELCKHLEEEKAAHQVNLEINLELDANYNRSRIAVRHEQTQGQKLRRTIDELNRKCEKIRRKK